MKSIFVRTALILIAALNLSAARAGNNDLPSAPNPVPALSQAQTYVVNIALDESTFNHVYGGAKPEVEYFDGWIPKLKLHVVAAHPGVIDVFRRISKGKRYGTQEFYKVVGVVSVIGSDHWLYVYNLQPINMVGPVENYLPNVK